MLVKLSYYPAVPHLSSSTGLKRLTHKAQLLPREDAGIRHQIGFIFSLNRFPGVEYGHFLSNEFSQEEKYSSLPY